MIIGGDNADKKRCHLVDVVNSKVPLTGEVQELALDVVTMLRVEWVFLTVSTSHQVSPHRTSRRQSIPGLWGRSERTPSL